MPPAGLYAPLGPSHPEGPATAVVEACLRLFRERGFDFQ